MSTLGQQSKVEIGKVSLGSRVGGVSPRLIKINCHRLLHLAFVGDLTRSTEASGKAAGPITGCNFSRKNTIPRLPAKTLADTQRSWWRLYIKS